MSLFPTTVPLLQSGNFVEQLAQNGIGFPAVRALNWKQPYGELMLHGKIETRRWATKVRGWVLICTSQQGYSRKQCSEIAGNHNMQRIDNLIQYFTNPFMGHLNSAAIGIGYLHECRPMTIEDENDTFCNFFPGLWCHVYKHVHAIEPFHWGGSQKWKIVDHETIKKIIIK